MPLLINLEEAKITGLEIFANPADLRHDLHAFLTYARDHEIKRTHRDNRIPLAEAQRLAKLMSDPASASQDRGGGPFSWIDHVDWLALRLKFVEYDTKGIYAGYTSSSPSFPDNFIRCNEQACEQFLNLPLQAQEERILKAHLDGTTEKGNEFFHQGVLSRLERFPTSSDGVVATILFPKVRKFLLKLLAQCPSGVWLSTASLIQHLRLHNPWFLIPEILPKEAETRWRPAVPLKRYGNFIERKKDDWAQREPIADTDPHGFDKVEGRYLERFLEGFPLVLGYTEVAYEHPKNSNALTPSRGLLAAFRVTDRLRLSLGKEIAPPKVTVLPNFEVHVESLFYSAKTETTLRPFGDLVQRGIVSVFKLTKSNVAAAMAANPNQQSVVDVLTELSRRELPANVRQELDDWVGHSEKFILYDGFGVLEGLAEATGAGEFIEETISPDVALVRSPEKLFQHLEKTEQVPLRIQHSEKALALPGKFPTNVSSRLAPKAPAASATPSKQPVKIKRAVQSILTFTEAQAHAAFRKMLLDAKCVVSSDERALTVSYSRKAGPIVKECLAKLKEHYAVSIEEIDT